ncbi:hypothetical protein C0145_02820 [Moraxella catarrhalis]|nr:hypothetical protein [Moraxella catarrhalis]MPW63122.1 hypothetical protein [Moraxella catarrhalis]MPX54246.1 hypothetical protein [Moraxella catarrhalis]
MAPKVLNTVFDQSLCQIHDQSCNKMSEYRPIRSINHFGNLYTISSVWMVLGQQYILFFLKIKD